MYVEPKQPRAIASEAKFLAALSELLLETSYHNVTVADIAERAALSSGAFVTRFGTKRAALDRLFHEFCTDVYDVLDAIAASLPAGDEATESTLLLLSETYESLVMKHWGANRAMHEVFLVEEQIDLQTRGIFKATTDLFVLLFASPTDNPTPGQMFAAVQLLVTLNYNFCLGAMPGLPSISADRHRIISRAIHCAMRS